MWKEALGILEARFGCRRQFSDIKRLDVSAIPIRMDLRFR